MIVGDNMRLRVDRIILAIFIFLFLMIGCVWITKTIFFKQEISLISLEGKNKEEVVEYLEKNNLKGDFSENYNSKVEKNFVISQEPKEGTKVKENDIIRVNISLGKIPNEVYREKKVNELGRVPIMMYHGIINISSDETKYTGGNVDKDGYNRTAEAFRNDLQFYYENGYRMIRLIDYVHGKIDVELGYSPIILTFDDGREDNFKVLGIDDNGELIIDPNCAVGILEEMKKKYPDFGVTATFFVNSGLFQQKEYNEQILKWLIEHGYDVGNHTTTHPDFTKISEEKSVEVVAKVYQQLDSLIPNQYVPIVALPFGSPYKKSHVNFSHIINGTYQNYSYQTEAALRVGWEAEVSPFANNFDPLFLKRIRAYDNNGKDFDIKMAFQQIQNSRYISDGDSSTIVIPHDLEGKISSSVNLQKVIYE